MLHSLLFGLLSAALAPQGAGEAPATAPVAAAAEDPVVVRDFGAPGAVGSFRVKFDRRGAGIFSLQLLDHYVSLDAARREQHEPGDYQLLVFGGTNHSLRLQLDSRSASLFGVPLGSAPWNVEQLPDAVRFTIEGKEGLQLAKTFRHRPSHRELALEIELRLPEGSKPLPDAVAFLDLLGPVLINPVEASMFGNPAVAIGTTADATQSVVKPHQGPSQVLFEIDGRELGFAGATNRFFAAFLHPLDEASSRVVHKVEVDSVPSRKDNFTDTEAFSVAQPVYGFRMNVPQPGAASVVRFGIYLGPKSYTVFSEQPEHARFEPVMDVDLEPPCCIVVPGGRLMASMLLKLLGFFHGLVGNWGVAIMMLTILVRAALAPVNFRMQKSMRAYASRMAVLKPKLDKIKADFEGDAKGYQQAMVAFQRENKMMPPIGGCLPIFATMPIYLGLFSALRTAYDLRQAPLFPFWIEDLSQPDQLFHTGLSWFPHFNLLPLLWIGMFLVMQLKMPLPTDPQQRQVQQIMRFMPVLFGVMLYNYASGLMVYMVTSMVWSMVESNVTKKILGPMDPNVQSMAPTPMM